jgi:hypothetical protein
MSIDYTRPLHDFDEDGICTWCGFDGAEEHHLRVNCTPAHARGPVPDFAIFCRKAPATK